MKTIQIKNIKNEIIYEHTAENNTIKITIEKMVKEGISLYEADLCGVDLCGADLCGADLREADLHGANLCGANLFRANLCETNLYRATLSGCNF